MKSVPTTLLSLLAFGLFVWAGTGVVAVVRDDPLSPPLARVGPSVSERGVSSVPAATPPADLAAAILERPLFSETRRPVVPPLAIEPITPRVEPAEPSARLAGIVRGAGGPVAIFAWDDGRTVFLEVGEDVESGWRLVRIDRFSVLLAGRDGELAFDLPAAEDLGRIGVFARVDASSSMLASADSSACAGRCPNAAAANFSSTDEDQEGFE